MKLRYEFQNIWSWDAGVTGVEIGHYRDLHGPCKRKERVYTDRVFEEKKAFLAEITRPVYLESFHLHDRVNDD